MKIRNVDLKKFIFDYLYLLLGLIYIFCMPIITLYLFNTKNYELNDIARFTNKFSLVLCVVVLFVFLLDIFLNKDRRRIIRNRKVVYIFILFIVWCFISTLLSNNFDNSMYGIPFRFGGFIQYLSYFSFAIIGFSLSEKSRIILFRIFVFVSLCIGLLTLFREKITFINLPVSYDFCGIFFNINHYGYYILYTVMICMFLFFEDKKIIFKIVDFLLYCFFLYILMVNNTFGCYLAIFLVLVFIFIYLFKKKQKILYIFVIVPFVLLSLFTKVDGSYIVRNNIMDFIDDVKTVFNASKIDAPMDSYDNPIAYVGTFRGTLWIRGVKYTLEKPIFGYGLDNLAQKYSADDIPMDMPHNLLLQLSLTVGIPGMIMYIVGLVIIVVSGLKHSSKNNHLINLCFFMIIAHVLSAMFGVTMYYVTPYYIIFLGMAIRSMKKD